MCLLHSDRYCDGVEWASLKIRLVRALVLPCRTEINVGSLVVSKETEGDESFTEDRKRFEGYGRSFGLQAFYESFPDVYGYLQAILHSLLGCTYVFCVFLFYASLGLRSILYSIALTIVHLDGTPILSLYTISRPSSC